ncbi:sensor histidine kinase [Synoicihabitans lomoniglobus]|uniref:histidine kinase n=1 Tax=Synoicihabitans lomoniglobus TaxID=2909285 RepID=A0AAF0CRV0_9BACT|nr:ATP-binding protein [Opitutaceae bacterium LMO-M01]WED66947.1 ATP-binding protein [Opitutaceae bacterium LMO-M01]
MAKPTRNRLNHDQHVLVGVLLAGLPAVIVSMWHLWFAGDQQPKVQWTLSLLIIGFWLGFAFSVQNRVVRSLQTMANLLSALREGDFSIRARGANRDNAMGDVMSEINSLGAILKAQRLGAMEATALLRTVMEEIDVAIFAFDGDGVLRLVNRSGQELLASPAEKILGRSAPEIGLAECINGPDTGVLEATDFPGGTGRWGMRRTSFREGGLPHELVVVADLSEALREEELKAWQRLVRVLGHELNNSLAPIKSIAGSLGSMLKRPQRADDWEEDLRGGLEIIANRAEGLSRFMQAYSRLAKLPKPVKSPCEVHPLLHQVVRLELRHKVEIVEGPAVTVPCDGPQIEQVLINLIKNAVEATLEAANPDDESEPPIDLPPPPSVKVTWDIVGKFVEFRVIDAGPGIGKATNLFVPFFTTKPAGSGIGLVLCRQIAENHDGDLVLENRTDTQGCIAVLRLPA